MEYVFVFKKIFSAVRWLGFGVIIVATLLSATVLLLAYDIQKVKNEMKSIQNGYSNDED